MKRLSLFAILLLATIALAQQSNWGNPTTKELKGKSKGHTYRVVLKVRNFKADGRKVTFKPDPYKEIVAENILINGAEVYGFDGIYNHMAPKGTSALKVLQTHATEIYQFDVWLDGKRIRIPRKKYEIALQADLKTASAQLSDDGKTFFVYVSGADGAAIWSARWVIERKNGKVNIEIARGG